MFSSMHAGDAGIYQLHRQRGPGSQGMRLFFAKVTSPMRLYVVERAGGLDKEDRNHDGGRLPELRTWLYSTTAAL